IKASIAATKILLNIVPSPHIRYFKYSIFCRRMHRKQLCSLPALLKNNHDKCYIGISTATGAALEQNSLHA
ncbi:hypothetical protein, partial [Phascolarctobacterium succinatutens]|uniref:hypothetical protein n=1 Tax=Phascolarctobacterium succinatutens TaxID=626940 RepID=UPI0026EC5AF3